MTYLRRKNDVSGFIPTYVVTLSVSCIGIQRAARGLTASSFIIIGVVSIIVDTFVGLMA